MLRIVIKGTELYNEATNSFDSVDDVTVEFEHSLVSLSKWEAEFQKPFLGPGPKTSDEVLAYIKFMLLTDVDPKVINRMSRENLETINSYIDSSQTATTFGPIPKSKGTKREVITSELIYYWMVAYSIPFECERWHLNRLFTLIRVCDVKNSKPKKMSGKEVAAQRRALNEQRRKALGTRG